MPEPAGISIVAHHWHTTNRPHSTSSLRPPHHGLDPLCRPHERHRLLRLLQRHPLRTPRTLRPLHHRPRIRSPTLTYLQVRRPPDPIPDSKLQTPVAQAIFFRHPAAQPDEHLQLLRFSVGFRFPCCGGEAFAVGGVDAGELFAR